MIVGVERVKIIVVIIVLVGNLGNFQRDLIINISILDLDIISKLLICKLHSEWHSLRSLRDLLQRETKTGTTLQKN